MNPTQLIHAVTSSVTDTGSDHLYQAQSNVAPVISEESEYPKQSSKTESAIHPVAQAVASMSESESLSSISDGYSNNQAEKKIDSAASLETNNSQEEERARQVACDYATKNAEPRSVGKCAKYVRLALERAKLKGDHVLPSAKDYMSIVAPEWGWQEVSVTPDTVNQVAKKGDVIIFAGNKAHPHGHIQIALGDGKYVSDFIQKSWKPSSTYPVTEPPSSSTWKLFSPRVVST